MPVESELVPVGGGDNIPLVRDQMTIGRRESCDICLRFPNISGRHCELTFKEGYWEVQDLKSTNGIRVNGERVEKKVLRPGDTISIASRSYTIEYALQAGMSAMNELLEDNIMDRPLLEKAGLIRPRRERKGRRAH